jgi:hypothetical protein
MSAPALEYTDVDWGCPQNICSRIARVGPCAEFRARDRGGVSRGTRSVESVTFVTEPLLHPDFVQYKVVVPLLERLQSRWDVKLAAPILAPAVVKALEDLGIEPLSGGALFPPWLRNSRDEAPSYIWSWARDSVFGWNRRAVEWVLKDHPSVRVNYSMTSAFRTDFWFVQSRPLGPGLNAIRRSVDLPLRVALGAAGPFVDRVDWHHLAHAASLSKRVYTSSQHLADWFRHRGVKVTGVSPIFYSPEFRPTTRSPSRDFILSYLGKETDTEAMTQLLESGLPVRIFGAKTAGWVGKVYRGRRYPNARFMGRVSGETLRQLYTNALFTAFPFTDESFGLVPVESMACGTPVLTYGMQGPAETVQDGLTGWTVRNPRELVDRAKLVFKDGYSPEISQACLHRAVDYSLDTVASNWTKLLDKVSPDGLAARAPARALGGRRRSHGGYAQ